MKSVVIKGQIRESLGKKEAKKLRSQELVPAVLYGSEEVTLTLKVKPIKLLCRIFSGTRWKN